MDVSGVKLSVLGLVYIDNGKLAIDLDNTIVDDDFFELNDVNREDFALLSKKLAKIFPTYEHFEEYVLAQGLSNTSGGIIQGAYSFELKTKRLVGIVDFVSDKSFFPYDYYLTILYKV